MPLQETSGAASYDAFGGGVPVVPTYIEDVFSTWLYTGNGSTQTINNGIDLAGKGGMVWTKGRNAAQPNSIFDTARGATNQLVISTDANNVAATSLTAFNSNGFSLAQYGDVNSNGTTMVSWTFREAPKFFDVVTYTGNDVAGRQIAHTLGSAPGCVIIKPISFADNWRVWHRGVATQNGVLNSTGAFSTAGAANRFGDGTNVIAPTSTVFTVGSDGGVNSSGQSYVAYLFAHDAGGFGLTGTDNVVSCGSYTGNGSLTGPVITLGYEPQWLMVKNTSTNDDWFVIDNMRGWTTNGMGGFIKANNSGTEGTVANEYWAITSTGFRILNTTNNAANTNGNNYIYIAIRRGPMRTPTTGTSVFSPIAAANGTTTQNTTGFPVDFQLSKLRNTAGEGPYAVDRLRGVSTNTTGNNTGNLVTSSTGAEGTDTNTLSLFWNNTGFQTPNYYGGSDPAIYWNFRRAPSVFDVVCYTGNATAGRTVTHNLTVAPELIIARQRSGGDWYIYSSGTTATKFLVLNSAAAAVTDSSLWNNTTPTSSVFTLGNATGVNRSNTAFVSYLFASCPGVSKVGSYTGNGSSQTINCGFTGGARLVMIKRTDSTGDWYVWDTARGIVSGNDPHLSLNTTAAEVTSNDTIDTDSTGFVVNQVSATNVNVSSATYIYLAIA